MWCRGYKVTLLKACLHQYGNITVKLYHRFLKSLRILAMIQKCTNSFQAIVHYENSVLRYRNCVARDENRVAWDASCERVVIYFSAVLQTSLLRVRTIILYYRCILYNDVNATCAVIGCAHDLLENRAIQCTWMTSQETCFSVLFCFCTQF